MVQVSISRSDSDETVFKLTIKGINDRKFKFKASSLKMANSWLAIIGKHIQNSEGYNQNKTSESGDKPWKFDNISELQFKALADTGDILLF